MATFVLVHGAWGGAHTWRGVRPKLWAAGHAVFTPSLTGVGERHHLTSPHVDLTVHVSDVVNTILYEDLDDIVLVGFSYGGAVVVGALEHIGGRVRDVVFLDAFVPADGQSVADLSSHDTESAVPTGAPGEAWQVLPPAREFDDPAETEFAVPRRTPQPVRTFAEPVRLLQPLEEYPFGRTYIKALGDPRRDSGKDPFWDAADRYRDNPAWHYIEHPSNHMIPQNDPEGLTAILLTIA
jgi:pimeloyl-ACP methyl ester carboxylesterase